ncbi:MAG: hypothetical protein V3T80_03520 [Kiloniellales bacterium]|jgi:hypothetical protein
MPAAPNPERPRSTLDRPLARVLAFAVFLLMAALLAWISRDLLFPPDQAAGPAPDDPVALCLAPRLADIAEMRETGTIDANRASLFKSRAEAFCEDQFGKGSGPPPPR